VAIGAYAALLRKRGQEKEWQESTCKMCKSHVRRIGVSAVRIGIGLGIQTGNGIEMICKSALGLCYAAYLGNE
jgi:hypothetical protein